MKAARFELVVARHREPLDWLRRVPDAFRITVYDKSGEPGPPAGRPLPNIGREAHTYLTHLVENYPDFAERTVFCQGHPFDHASDFHRILRAIVAGERPVRDFDWIGFLVDTDDRRGERLFVPWSKNPEGRCLDLDGFHQALLGTAGPSEYVFVGGGQFSVSRELLLRREAGFYRRALRLARDFPDAAHCFERCWDRCFGVEGVDRSWLAGRRTVYRHPPGRRAAGRDRERDSR